MSDIPTKEWEIEQLKKWQFFFQHLSKYQPKTTQLASFRQIEK